jgi:hypothetical protein
MSIKTRKFLGVVATLVFLAAYSLVAMAIGGQFVTGQGKLVELLYFVVAGIGWVPVAMLIVRWMSRGASK